MGATVYNGIPGKVQGITNFDAIKVKSRCMAACFRVCNWGHRLTSSSVASRAQRGASPELDSGISSNSNDELNDIEWSLGFGPVYNVPNALTAPTP